METDAKELLEELRRIDSERLTGEDAIKAQLKFINSKKIRESDQFIFKNY